MYNQDSEKDIVVLKKIAGSYEELIRRFIISKNEFVVQYWNHAEMQWFDLDAKKYSSSTNEAIGKLIVEQHNEIERLKMLVEETAKAGEDLVSKIEERKSQECFNSNLKKYKSSSTSKFHQATGEDADHERSEIIGFMHGYHNALRDLDKL